jgi:starch-binding outer membrane protein, SusD/RagB family
MNMKKIVLLIIPILFVMSCEKKLDLTNPNNLSTDTYWSTEDQATAACIAVYQQLIMEGCYMHWTQVLTDGRGDEIRSVGPWLNYTWTSDFTLCNHSDDPFMQRYVWEDYYRLLFRANQVLEKVPSITMDEDLKTRILGQTYFLRGLAFFNLAKLFNSVPVITATPKQYSDYFPFTSTQEELWNQVYSDFLKAIDMLPVSYANVTGSDKGQTGRATKGAAIGMLGKAYLYKGEWQKAADQFSLLINGPDVNIYSLVSNYADNFTITNENNSESLFEVQFATTDQVGGTTANWHGDPTATYKQVCAMACNYSNKGWTDFKPTQWLVDEFNSERTKDGKIDPRLHATVAWYDKEEGDTLYYGTGWVKAEMDTTAMYIKKYTNDNTPDYTTELNGSDPISGINYRVLRYADVLLSYAECQNELGNVAECAKYIQIVRNRANMPDREAEFAALSQADMRTRISHERVVEFSIEGQRVDDLIRWGWFYDNTKLAELITHDSEFSTWTSGREYLPIPQNELDVNTNLSPNSAN